MGIVTLLLKLIFSPVKLLNKSRDESVVRVLQDIASLVGRERVSDEGVVTDYSLQ
jgi:hypothetical protein